MDWSTLCKRAAVGPLSERVPAQATGPVVVSEAHGEVREIRALPGRAPMACHRPHAPEGRTVRFAGASA